MVKIHQSIKEQASLRPTILSPMTTIETWLLHHLIKEKLSAMQTQALQGRMQPSPTYFRNEMANARVPIGPVKKQVTEAWSTETNNGETIWG
jgi:hypothetical protein